MGSEVLVSVASISVILSWELHRLKKRGEIVPAGRGPKCGDDWRTSWNHGPSGVPSQACSSA